MEPTPDTTQDQLFPEHLDAGTARHLIECARSPRREDADFLAVTGMTRGLRHVRLAVEIVNAQRMQQLARSALWVSIFAAIAAIASAVAAFLTFLA